MESNKKIEDYLHLYRGVNCLILNTNRTAIFNGFTVLVSSGASGANMTYLDGINSFHTTPDNIKPFLRPLSSMTEEEAAYIDDEFSFGHVMSNLSNSLKEGSLYQMRVSETFEITRYLLSKGFDLFGLIEAGLAIDSTKQL